MKVSELLQKGSELLKSAWNAFFGTEDEESISTNILDEFNPNFKDIQEQIDELNEKLERVKSNLDTVDSQTSEGLEQINDKVTIIDSQVDILNKENLRILKNQDTMREQLNKITLDVETIEREKIKVLESKAENLFDVYVILKEKIERLRTSYSKSTSEITRAVAFINSLGLEPVSKAIPVEPSSKPKAIKDPVKYLSDRGYDLFFKDRKITTVKALLRVSFNTLWKVPNIDSPYRTFPLKRLEKRSALVKVSNFLALNPAYESTALVKSFYKSYSASKATLIP